jgi:hypothetical protein
LRTGLFLPLAEIPMKSPIRRVLLATVTAVVTALAMTACSNPTGPTAASASPISLDGPLNGTADCGGVLNGSGNCGVMTRLGK